MSVSDLIYNKCHWPAIQQQYPNAKLADASDMVHPSRFCVYLEIEDKYEYLRWLFESTTMAYADSFMFQLWLIQDHKDAMIHIEQWREAYEDVTERKLKKGDV